MNYVSLSKGIFDDKNNEEIWKILEFTYFSIFQQYFACN
jgi:hypothetical protein